MRKDLYQELYSLENSHWWHISKRKIVRKLIEKYNHLEDPKILDVGCGTGKNMEDLKSLGIVYGLDSSPDAISFCKKRGLKNLILAYAEKTHFKKSSFDIVTLLDVLEHTDDYKTLKEVYRILKINGLLVITVPAFNWLWSSWDVVLHHQRRYTTNNLVRILKKENFEVIKISYIYSFLVLPALVIRTLKSFFFKKLYPSDFKLSSSFFNQLMLKFTDVEAFLIILISIPIGTSIIAVAKKTDGYK